MAQHPFPLVSDEATEFTPIEFGREDGDSVMYVEEVYQGEEDPKSCNKVGDRIGWVTIEETKVPKQGFVRITADFEFDNGESLRLVGIVPKDPDSGKLGPGKVSTGAGTGPFRENRLEVGLRSCNPKRWSIEGAG